MVAPGLSATRRIADTLHTATRVDDDLRVWCALVALPGCASPREHAAIPDAVPIYGASPGSLRARARVVAEGAGAAAAQQGVRSAAVRRAASRTAAFFRA